ncbi:MAG: CPBP family intramembrane glutamic endopeptidase [bacterium]|nr:CPBP family intramembrane glutamic endopeptidase [bacterium]
MNPVILKFLGKDRIKTLLIAIGTTSSIEVRPAISLLRGIIAIFIALLPVFSQYLVIYKDTVDITTVFIGVATCLAVLFRIRHKIPFLAVSNWKTALSLTHTAFALGCIPIVVLLIINPNSFVPVHQNAQVNTFNAEGPPIVSILFFIFSVSVWAGLTEEIIYRGLVISAIRRCAILGKQITRDRLAILISALLFGLSHYPVWGFPVALSLVGLGIGFGMAYLAIGERVLPLVVYHIAFDILSLSFSYMAHKI